MHMSGPAAENPEDRNRDFHETFARWQRELRSEVQRASLLPNAMFEATDPMLEMQLAETTDRLLSLVERPPDHVTAESERGRRRLEPVDPREIERLTAEVAARPGQRPDLLASLGHEFLGVLAEVCSSPDIEVRRRAAHHLVESFRLTPGQVEELIADYREAVQAGCEQRGVGVGPGRIEAVADALRAALHEQLSSAPREEPR